jgi:hypothetical protein
VYIVDGSGSDMTAPQDTPVAINKEGNYLVYNVDVFIQKCIDSLPSGKLCKSKKYFSYIVAVIFIGGGNQSTRRKPLTCCKSLTKFIT